jgi:copper chaperone CopZ
VTKTVFRITDMHCPNCAMHLDALEDELPGIKAASASYTKGTLVVEYDENKITEAEIREAIHEKGYTAQPTQAV